METQASFGQVPAAVVVQTGVTFFYRTDWLHLFVSPLVRRNNGLGDIVAGTTVIKTEPAHGSSANAVCAHPGNLCGELSREVSTAPDADVQLDKRSARSNVTPQRGIRCWPYHMAEINKATLLGIQSQPGSHSSFLECGAGRIIITSRCKL
jgi:hypothetical protein